MSATFTQHPQAIRKLAEQLGLDPAIFIDESRAGRRGFFRYGRKIADACRYCLKGDQIIGLSLRGQNVSNLKWLENEAFNEIEDLLLGDNTFTSLTIPAGWTKLRRLDLSHNSSLERVIFRQGTTEELERLEITDSGLYELTLPTTGCPKLQFLDLSRSEVKKLVLSGPCSSIHSLHLRAAAQLETLEIETLLSSLDTLDLAQCPKLKAIPQDTVMASPLERLYLQGTAPKNCPGVFLEKDTNSLVSVRGWITELRRKPTGNRENKTIKLQVTGNGNVGKSTLLCALAEAELVCQHDDHDRTHGIIIDSIQWVKEDIFLNYWDFGGQEIYRGTHRLFTTERALHLLVFDPETEKQAVGGKRGGNRTGGQEGKQVIQYFYDTIKEGAGNRITVLQNKKEEFSREDSRIADWAESEGLGFRHVDARSGSGLKRLKQQLTDDIDQLPGYGMIFPAEWLAVRDWFVSNLQAKDISRVIDRNEYLRICQDYKVGQGYEDLLLDYLAAAGYCYRHERLDGKIIADQRWALTGIYQLFDPEDASEDLADSEGKVRVKRLFQYFDETEEYDYTEAEKWLLLDFLESCGLCFSVADREERSDNQHSLKDRYILPEYLPLEEDPREAGYWTQLGGKAIVLRKSVDYINYPAFHAFLCKVGRKTTKPRLWYGGVDVRTNEGERFLVRLVPGDQPCYEIMVSPGSESWVKVLKETSSLGEEGWETISGTVDESRDTAPKEKSEMKIDDLQNQLSGIQDTTVFFLFANPPGTTQISCEKELATLRSYRDEHPDQRFFDFIGRGKLSYRSLVDALCSVREPRIIHFVGHGDDASENAVDRGLVVYENEGTQSRILNAKRLGEVFKEAKTHHNPQLEVVLLNSCVSSEQAIAISRAGIYVVGTTIEIGDESAIEFALAFYKECASTEALDEQRLCAAMNKGVIASIGAYGRRAEDIYQLYFDGEVVPFRYIN